MIVNTYSYTNLPSGVRSCRSDTMSFLRPTLSIAVTLTVTGRLLFNPVTFKDLLSDLMSLKNL